MGFIIEWFYANYIWLTAVACGLYLIAHLLEKYACKKKTVDLNDRLRKNDVVEAVESVVAEEN